MASNRHGVTVGYDAPPNDDYEGLVWDEAGNASFLPSPDGVSQVYPQNVNDGGVITGTTRGNLYRYENGVAEDLGHPTQTGFVASALLNNAGMIAGVSWRSNGEGYRLDSSYVWYRESGFHVIPRTSDEIRFYDMNERGEICGHSWRGSFVYRNGNFDFISSNTFFAERMANDGTILGVREANQTQSYELYRNGIFTKMDDLMPAGWRFFGALDISPDGRILATATRDNGNYRATVLLTPVPEPGTWAAFLVGGAWILRRRVAGWGQQLLCRNIDFGASGRKPRSLN